MFLNIRSLSIAFRLIPVVQRHAVFRLRNTRVLLDLGGGFVDGRAVLGKLLTKNERINNHQKNNL